MEIDTDGVSYNWTVIQFILITSLDFYLHLCVCVCIYIYIYI
jgi:hypothetical protein